MPAVGMLVLGAFLGFVSIYALMKVADWTNPIATLGGVIAAVLAVSVFTIFEVAVTPIGDAIYFYPIGLGFGALCGGMQWIGGVERANLWPKAWLHMGASALAAMLILILVFSDGARRLLPQSACPATVPHEDRRVADAYAELCAALAAAQDEARPPPGPTERSQAAPAE